MTFGVALWLCGCKWSVCYPLYLSVCVQSAKVQKETTITMTPTHDRHICEDIVQNTHSIHVLCTVALFPIWIQPPVGAFAPSPRPTRANNYSQASIELNRTFQGCAVPSALPSLLPDSVVLRSRIERISHISRMSYTQYFAKNVLYAVLLLRCTVILGTP